MSQDWPSTRDWPTGGESALADWLHEDMEFPPANAERLARKLAEMSTREFGEDD